MGKFFFDRAMTSVVAAVALVFVSSCVNSKYELSEENLDLKVTVFQDGVSLPLGSTDKISLQALYSYLGPEAQKYLQDMDGAYMFHASDKLDVPMGEITDALSAIRSMEGISFDREFAFPLDNVNLSGFTVTGQKITPKPISVSDQLNIPDLNSYMPVISENRLFEATLPEVDADDLELDMSSLVNDLKSTSEIATLDGVVNIDALMGIPAIKNLSEIEMDYESLCQSVTPYVSLPALKTNFKFDRVTVEVPLSFALPKEIAAVKNIKLHPDASFELSFKIINSLFTSGSIIPSLDVDLHNLLHIDRIESGIEDGAHMEDVPVGDHFEQHVIDNFVMSAEYGNPKADDWMADHIYHVDALAIAPEDWKYDPDSKQLVLEKLITITMSGELITKELKTTLKHLNEHDNKPMQIEMEVKFNNFTIEDVEMGIAPIVQSQSMSLPIEVTGIKLPEMVKTVDFIAFDQSSPLKIDLSASLTDACKDLDISIKTLKIEFPHNFVINYNEGGLGTYDEGSHILSYKDLSLKNGLYDEVVIERMNLPEPDNSMLSYRGEVKVNAEAEARGELSSKQLIENGGSFALDIDVNYAPVLSDYCVKIDDIQYDVSELVGDFEPIEVPIEDKSVGEMLYGNPVVVSLKEDPSASNERKNPEIVLALNYPEHDVVNLYPTAEGLSIDFPDMLKFSQETISRYNIGEGNEIYFSSDTRIPNEEMVFEIEKVEINVNKETVEGVDKYFVKDEISVTGGVRLAGTKIHMADVQELKDMGAEVSFGVVIPDLVPAEFGLDEYEINIADQKISVGKIETQLPDMISSVSVTELALKDVYLDIEVDAASVKEILGDVTMNLDLQVVLPEMLIVESTSEGVTVTDENVLIISEPLGEENKMTIDGVHVVGFDLSAVEVKDGKLTLDVGDIPLTGSVKIENIVVDVDKLKDTDLDIQFKGALASRGEDNKPTENITIDKIVGYVGMNIDPVKTKVDLSMLSDYLNGDNMSATLDIGTFWLALDVATNIDIPLKGTLEVLPWYGGQQGEKIERTIDMDPEKRIDGSYKFFISNVDPAASEGRFDVYSDHDFIDLDLISMLYKREEGQKPVVADSMHINFVAGVNPEKPSVLEPMKDYTLGVEYNLGIPMELGSNFEFEYRDTISGLPDELGKLLEYGSIGLGGKVTNSFPIKLDLQFRLLDSNNKEVPMGEGAGLLTISSCNANGEPVSTPIDVILSAAKDADLTDISAIELVFKADSKLARGIPIGPESFLQVVLNARIPEGVTLDLGNLKLENEEEETNE